MAGAIGVPPWSYTWGELALMAEGKDEAQWWHTAALVSTVLGVVGVKREPELLNPYVRERRRIKDPQKLKDIAEAVDAANKASWRAFCDTFKK